MLAPRSLLVVAGLAVAACSGASASEILDPVSTEGANVEPPPTTTEASSTAGSSTGAPAEDAGAAPPMEEDAGTPARCLEEVEDNGTREKATPFESCIRGALANARDTDFLRIVAPEGVKKMRIEHEEKKNTILYNVSQEGGLILFGNTMFTDGPAEIPVTAGATYLLRLTVPFGAGGGGGGGGGNGERPYEVNVTFQ